VASPTHRRSLRSRRTALISAAAVAAAGLGAIPFVTQANAATDLAHQVLPAKDGWAASDTGTTGGSTADSAHIFTVSTRAQLIAALGSSSNTAAKIIQVQGTIDANTGTCADYASGTGYSLAAYLKAYDPATWGRSEVPSGTQESARAAAKAKQAKSIVFTVPSNTTIVGVPGSNATILGGSLMVQNVQNVILRNLTVKSPEDCFPQWDPTDGSTGNWNSEYDAVTLRGATHVWADHNTFTDGPTLDSAEPAYFGREYQIHDGALDITKGSDLVTVERNRFTNHDKTTLIGSSDTDSTGKLRVSIHHNVYAGIVQRAPLTRIGQVHIYNNYYDTTKLNGYAHSYTVNSRAGAQVVLQNNYWKLSSDRKVSQLVNGDGTGAIAGSGNLVNDTTTDLAAAYNATASSSKQLKTTVNWTPALTAGLESSAKTLPTTLATTTGAGALTTSGTS
jgi:pectate lyase